jgi:hypothetical protein
MRQAIMDKFESRPDQTPAWFVACLTVLFVAVAIGYYGLMRSQPYDGDSVNYIAMAEGRVSEVHKPYTARVLHPAFAGFLSRTTGLSVDASFFVTNVMCLAVLVRVGISLVLRQVPSVQLAMAIVLAPVVLLEFREIYMPDIMHAAFAAVFFLLLVRGALWYAVPLLFLMQVTRESTLLLTFFVFLFAAYHRKFWFAGAAIVFTILGMGVVSRVAGEGQGNVHGASALVYFVGKVPFNALPNLFGVQIWTNTHAKNDPETFPDEPLVTFDLPSWLPSGSMRQVGIYKFNLVTPLTTLRIFMNYLGIVPSLVFLAMFWKRWRLTRQDELSFASQIALAYGVTSYLLVPFLGASIGRYVAYAWPMAWVATPELLARNFDTNHRFIGRLASLQAIACWTPLLLKVCGVALAPLNVISIAVAIPCHAIAVKLLRRTRIAADG